jgi:hypothetical protein
VVEVVAQQEEGEVDRTSYRLYHVLDLLHQCYTTLLYPYIPAFESDLVDKKLRHIGVVLIWI